MDAASETAVDLLMELAMDVLQVPHSGAGEMRFVQLLKECDDYAEGRGVLSGTITDKFLQLSRLYFKYIDTKEPCPVPHLELLLLRNRMVRRELRIEGAKETQDDEDN